MLAIEEEEPEKDENDCHSVGKETVHHGDRQGFAGRDPLLGQHVDLGGHTTQTSQSHEVVERARDQGDLHDCGESERLIAYLEQSMQNRTDEEIAGGAAGQHQRCPSPVDVSEII